MSDPITRSRGQASIGQMHGRRAREEHCSGFAAMLAMRRRRHCLDLTTETAAVDERIGVLEKDVQDVGGRLRRWAS
jgi:hypothetical protein